MKYITKLYIYLSLITLLVSCDEMDVSSEYDTHVDFSAYQTYEICSDDMVVVNRSYPKYDNVSNRKKIKNTIITKMNELGYQLNESDPELQVGFEIVIKDQKANVTNCGSDDTYDYWPECTIDTYYYTEGTLMISVSDIKKNQVIWQGAARGVLGMDEDQVGKVIEKTVEHIFNEYPMTVAI